MVIKDRIILLFLIFVLLQNMQAQTYIFDYNIKVNQFGNTLKFPFAGGLNNPQFSAIDINHDELKDIFIFDRTGNKSLVLINEGSFGETNYFYWQQYQQSFPLLSDWAILVDYNCDGIEDIISGYDGGVCRGHTKITIYGSRFLL